MTRFQLNFPIADLQKARRSKLVQMFTVKTSEAHIHNGLSAQWKNPFTDLPMLLHGYRPTL